MREELEQKRQLRADRMPDAVTKQEHAARTQKQGSHRTEHLGAQEAGKQIVRQKHKEATALNGVQDTTQPAKRKETGDILAAKRAALACSAVLENTTRGSTEQLKLERQARKKAAQLKSEGTRCRQDLLLGQFRDPTPEEEANLAHYFSP